MSYSNWFCVCELDLPDSDQLLQHTKRLFFLFIYSTLFNVSCVDPGSRYILRLSFIEQPNALFVFALARFCLMNTKSFYVYWILSCPLYSDISCTKVFFFVSCYALCKQLQVGKQNLYNYKIYILRANITADSNSVYSNSNNNK